MIQNTIHKSKSKGEIITMLKMQTQHFAILELHILKRGIMQVRQAKIAGGEFTRNKFNLRQFNVGQIAVLKPTGFVLAHRQSTIAQVMLRESPLTKIFSHAFTDNQTAFARSSLSWPGAICLVGRSTR